MGRALIIGVFERLGFHLCKKLLEMGYEVRGISWNSASDESEEDMELEIGRNSNFVKLHMGNEGTFCERDNAIIFSLYDLYTDEKSPNPHSERLAVELEELIRMNSKWPSVVMLLPNVPVQRNQEENGTQAIRKAADLAEASAENVLKVILPFPYNSLPIEGQATEKCRPEQEVQLPAAGNEAPDWQEAAERIALLIDKGETGTRILEGIYK